MMQSFVFFTPFRGEGLGRFLGQFGWQLCVNIVTYIFDFEQEIKNRQAKFFAPVTELGR